MNDLRVAVRQLVKSRGFTTVAVLTLALGMLTLFAGVALVPAEVGLHGVLACVVTQRTREIGIRMALGAQKRNVLGLVIGQGMRLALAGVVIGIVAALALTRVMRNMSDEPREMSRVLPETRSA